MGRGRQKAKNTKVARELKYFSPATDFNSLEAELATKAASEEPIYEDKWADLYEDDGDQVTDSDPAIDDDRAVELGERE
jgi:hypothetical protein